MPLSAKGEEIKKAMEKEYGSEKGEQVFYASKNKGTISGVDAKPTEDYYTQACPEQITLAELNEQNKKLWMQKTAAKGELP